MTDESALRCGEALVEVGATKFEVKDKCGEPSDMEDGGDTWVYNFGSSQFVYYLTFMEGKLDRIQSGGYGQ